MADDETWYKRATEDGIVNLGEVKEALSRAEGGFERTVLTARLEEDGVELTSTAKKFLEDRQTSVTEAATGLGGWAVDSTIGRAVRAAVNAVFRLVVNPLFKGLLYLGILATGVVSVFFLGPDLELGGYPSFPGFADLPIFGVNATIDIMGPVASVPVTAIRTLNELLVGFFVGLGVSGPIVMMVVGAVEVVILGWLLVRAAELLQIEGLLNLALGPVKAAWGILR